MTTTRVRLWTVKEYHQMMTAGVFNPEERTELLEGEILQIPSFVLGIFYHKGTKYTKD
ncbi:MAG: hypothetical protein F6K41_19715 [Symploca sp. SIO3E6]|nr:hypothetical protein [Caldora sp. SIO3E6]